MLDKKQLQGLYRYCYSLCNHNEDAYDLLQSALERYLKNKGAHIKNEEAYIRSVARNLFIDNCRRNKIVLLESIEDHHEAVQPQVTLESIMFDDAEVDYLMRSLQPFEREVLFLSCVVGYTVTEIADQQTVSRNTVLSRLYRAKKKALKIIQQSRSNKVKLVDK